MNPWAMFFTFVLLLPACAPDIGEWVPQTGEEGQPCNENGECFGDLTCASDLCVALGGSDGSTVADAGATDGSSDGSSEGSSAADSGSADGTTDGSSAVDSGATDGSGEGSSVADAGVAEGLSCSTTGADAQCVYLDSTIGHTLTWQGCPLGQTGEDCSGEVERKNYASAVSYCQNLSWGGFDNWVLPNIDELRSLIRGCAETEFGSEECPITHECSYSSGGVDTCGVTTCTGCEEDQGPANGFYWPADLPSTYVEGATAFYWASTLGAHSGVARGVYFATGYLSDGMLTSMRVPRCVRNTP